MVYFKELRVACKGTVYENSCELDLVIYPVHDSWFMVKCTPTVTHMFMSPAGAN